MAQDPLSARGRFFIRSRKAFIKSRGDARAAFSQLDRNMVTLVNGLNAVSLEALEEIGEKILAISQERVPVDTGSLKASGFVESETSPKGPVVKVGYSPQGVLHYAVFVHENLEIPHNNPEGAQAKFLQSA